MTSEELSSFRILFENETFTRSMFGGAFFFADFELDLGITSRQLELFGFTEAELRSGAYKNRIHPEDLNTYNSLWSRVEQGWEDDFYCEYRVMDSNGIWHWLETQAKVVSRNGKGNIKLIIGLDRDISSRKHAEEFQRHQFLEIQHKFEVCEALRKTTNQVVSNLEYTDHFTIAINQIQQITPFELCEIFTLEHGQMKLVFETEECRGCETIPEISLNVPELETSMYPIITDDLGPDVKYRSALALPLRMNNQLVGAVFLRHTRKGFFRSTDLYPVLIFADSLAIAIRNQQHFQQTVSELESDELTKFLTRRSFEKSAPDIWKKCIQDHEVSSIAMIDIDHFKTFNDTYGHTAGDEVIRRLAQLVIGSLRKVDVIGRYGGEEFVLILPDTSHEVAISIMNRIRVSCSELTIPGIKQPITMSIGIASSSKVDQSLESLIEKADQALYKAKSLGRNQVVGA
jgi:diguanylate cyclase (GGDEF)-like protein/PAS domain S-box-containing protein